MSNLLRVIFYPTMGIVNVTSFCLVVSTIVPCTSNFYLIFKYGFITINQVIKFNAREQHTTITGKGEEWGRIVGRKEIERNGMPHPEPNI